MYLHFCQLFIFLPLIEHILGQDNEAATTTIYETTHHTFTITRENICTPLERCKNITWDLIFESNATTISQASASEGLSSGSIEPSISTTSQSIPISTNSDVPSQFVLQGGGQLSGYFLAFEENGNSILVQSGQMPQYLQLSSLGGLRTLYAPTEILFLRITDGNIARRQSFEGAEIGDLMHAVPEEVLSSDKTNTFYFVGSTLNLNWRGLIYKFYAAQRSDNVSYALKMAKEGEPIPSSYLPLSLSYLEQISLSSTMKSTSTISSSKPSGSTASSSPPSILAYDIITSFGYQSFCSQFLQYTGTVTATSTTESSTVTGIFSSIFTSLVESTTYTSTETTYTSTNYSAISVTQLSRRTDNYPNSRPGNLEIRQTDITTPSLLATFSENEIRIACSSAVSVPNTSTETKIATSFIPYESVTQVTATCTSNLATESTLTQTGALQTELAVNGYWKVVDPSLTDYVGQYFQIRAYTNGALEPYITKADNSTIAFKMSWNETTGSWNAYFTHFVSVNGAQTLEIRWLWYYINRFTYEDVLALIDAEENLQNRDLVRKAEFTIDNDGYATLVQSSGNGPVWWTCIFDGALGAVFTPLVFFGNTTGFQDFLSNEFANFPIRPRDCALVPRIKIIASGGAS